MRQKNTHGYPLTVPSIGLTVYPGEIIDHDVLLPGFEEVADEPSADNKASEAALPDTHSTDEPDAPAPDANHPAAPTEPAPDPATPGADPQEVTR